MHNKDIPLPIGCSVAKAKLSACAYYSPEVIEALKRNMKLSPETIAAIRWASGSWIE